MKIKRKRKNAGQLLLLVVDRILAPTAAAGAGVMENYNTRMEEKGGDCNIC